MCIRDSAPGLHKPNLLRAGRRNQFRVQSCPCDVAPVRLPARPRSAAVRTLRHRRRGWLLRCAEVVDVLDVGVAHADAALGLSLIHI
eukprot:9717775-Alexandrium_andersonii.AAC.1